jgi:copper(I)-binding protein
MINRFKRAFVAAALAALAAGPALAQDLQVGDLSLGQPTITPTRGQVMVNAAYFTIVNRSSAPDRLMSASSPAFDRIEIHTHVKEGDMMRMRPLPDGLPIPGMARVALERGGLHLMLYGAKAPLQPGDRRDITLTFERAGSITVTGVVGQPGAAAGGGHRH